MWYSGYMSIRNIDLESIKQAIESSTSRRQVLLSLGLTPTKQRTLNKIIEENDLDISHFVRYKLVELNEKRTRNFDEMFSRGTWTKGKTLKNQILKYSLMEYECQVCKNAGSWANKPLSLQVDHINGDNTDNRVHNLRFLCPNCHSQTDTYAGKNNMAL